MAQREPSLWVARHAGAAAVAIFALFHVVGQPLGGFADRAIVDGVAADRIHAAAAAAGAEGNRGPEGLFQFRPFFRRQGAPPLGGHNRARYGSFNHLRMFAAAEADNFPEAAAASNWANAAVVVFITAIVAGGEEINKGGALPGSIHGDLQSRYYRSEGSRGRDGFTIAANKIAGLLAPPHSATLYPVHALITSSLPPWA